MNDSAHLLAALRTAVALEIPQLAGLDAADRIDLARAGAETLQEGADAMLFGSAHKAQKRLGAAHFAALARALAAMAYQPGGVTFAGVHWCTDHQECLDAEAWAAGRLCAAARLVEERGAERAAATAAPDPARPEPSPKAAP